MNNKAFKKIAGPLLGIVVYLFFATGGYPEIMSRTAGIATWIAFWWITEAVNIYFTSLIPLFMFPLLGVMSMENLAPLYMQDVIFLFIGGFLIAYAIERWKLHKRVALKLILLVGATPSRILLGFMLSSYLLSMWIINTAVVTMLLPAVLAVVSQIETFNKDGGQSKLATPFLLGLAYASSIGGMATLIGTAPNFLFADFFNLQNHLQPEISFASWMSFGVPISIILFVLCFQLLKLIYRKSFINEQISLSYCEKEYKKLGKVTYEEKILTAIFILTVLLWFFRKDLHIGALTIKGWTNVLPNPEYVKESTIAMLMACFLFLFPARSEKTTLLNWQQVSRLPMGIIFLFGGGFALAASFKVSGLSEWIAMQMNGITNLSPLLIIVILCTAMTFLTELTSNTASTLLVLPILLSMSEHLTIHPLQLFIPVVLSASCAFMLPVATPPNTIVFGSERLSIRDMARTGIWMNLIGVLVISISAYFLISVVFSIN